MNLPRRLRVALCYHLLGDCRCGGHCPRNCRLRDVSLIVPNLDTPRSGRLAFLGHNDNRHSRLPFRDLVLGPQSAIVLLDAVRRTLAVRRGLHGFIFVGSVPLCRASTTQGIGPFVLRCPGMIGKSLPARLVILVRHRQPPLMNTISIISPMGLNVNTPLFVAN